MEASFLTQYGIRLIETEMDWKEFTVLLSGLMPETPLGKIVATRCEENKEILKHFSPEENRIRNDWRSKHSLKEEMTEAEMEKAVSSLQETLARAFG
ncbi:MAG: Gp15 family bacteriophage protein [Blautia sp.]|uniref:Gp15 family bacteriophage protein n=1 Tax=Blautia TaxID=572511 RepID=UPI002A80EB31|nr:Gp15 family bacteriophage protein [Blautia sp.]MDY4058107.1 Gp15 family bacteriophage protein [Blautia sp.]